MADKADTKAKTVKYKVLDWGAGTDDSPCSLTYIPAGGSTPRRAKAGDTVDDIPVSEIGQKGQEAFRNFIVGYHIALAEAVD